MSMPAAGPVLCCNTLSSLIYLSVLHPPAAPQRPPPGKKKKRKERAHHPDFNTLNMAGS